MNKPISTTIELKIPFYDVDSMEITWHGNYLKYFEQARCALLDKIDFNYLNMKASGYGWPIVEMRIKYIRPSLFNQIVLVEATLTEYENRLKIDYIVRDKATDEILTKAHSVQMAVDLNTREALLVSPKVLIDKVETFK